MWLDHHHRATGQERPTPFRQRIRELTDRCGEAWVELDGTGVEFGSLVSEATRRGNEARVHEMISRYRRTSGARTASDGRSVRRKTGEIIRLVAQSSSDCHREETEEMLRQFSRAGDSFVRDARKFDSGLGQEDVFQALRNLWIINSIQVGFSLPVNVSPSGFAYSLLYPYTDNYLDSRKVTTEQKQEFVRTLRLRLSGMTEEVAGDHGSRIGRLVGMIEREYPRSKYGELFESLLAIHDAQEKSLLQHAEQAAQSSDEILGITLEKGGTSVLADAYLAKGQLTEQEIRFSFDYGVFLQIIDDLQDLEEDIRSVHHTLCTIAAGEGNLEILTNRLIRFIRAVLDDQEANRLRLPAALSELVARSCSGLILEIIALHPQFFPVSYVAHAERYSAVSFAFIRELRSEAGANEKLMRKMIWKHHQAIPA